MRSLAMLALLLVATLAGCTQAPPATPTESPPAPRFAPGDLRVPVNATAFEGDVGPVLAFPLFADAVNMTTGGSARETSLAVSPLNNGVIFACDPSGVPNISGGHSYYYLSTDNGTTWTDLDIEPAATDPRRATFEGGDCDVAIDAAGTLYSADTWLGEIAVGSSKDLGKTWDVGNPVGAYAPVADRPWLVAGAAGVVYLSYQDVQFGMPSAIWFAKSTNYGLTFSPPIAAVTATPDGAYTWEGNYAISADGNDVYLVHTRQAGTQHDVGTSTPELVEVAVSHDGGMTWKEQLVSARPATASYLYPSITMDAGGVLHVVFSQATSKDQPIFYSSSRDQGVTWTEPVPLLAGVSAVSPWIAGGKAGQAVAVWFGSPDPKATAEKNADYYLYWARITGAEMGNATIVAATTSKEPLFHGKQRLGFAEFNMVRLDGQGRAHIGASVPVDLGNNRMQWQAMYQAQAEGPVT